MAESDDLEVNGSWWTQAEPRYWLDICNGRDAARAWIEESADAAEQGPHVQDMGSLFHRFPILVLPAFPAAITYLVDDPDMLTACLLADASQSLSNVHGYLRQRPDQYFAVLLNCIDALSHERDGQPLINATAALEVARESRGIADLSTECLQAADLADSIARLALADNWQDPEVNVEAAVELSSCVPVENPWYGEAQMTLGDALRRRRSPAADPDVIVQAAIECYERARAYFGSGNRGRGQCCLRLGMLTARLAPRQDDPITQYRRALHYLVEARPTTPSNSVDHAFLLQVSAHTLVQLGSRFIVGESTRQEGLRCLLRAARRFRCASHAYAANSADESAALARVQSAQAPRLGAYHDASFQALLTPGIEVARSARSAEGASDLVRAQALSAEAALRATRCELGIGSESEWPYIFQCFLDAGDLFVRAGQLGEAQTTFSNCGNVAIERAAWQVAKESYTKSLDVADTRIRTLALLPAREAVRMEVAPIVAGLVRACFLDEDNDGAVETIERFLGRLLLDFQATRFNSAPAVPADLRTRFLELSVMYYAVQDELRAAAVAEPGLALTAARSVALREKQIELLEQINAVYGDFLALDGDLALVSEPLSIDGIKQLARELDSLIVYPWLIRDYPLLLTVGNDGSVDAVGVDAEEAQALEDTLDTFLRSHRQLVTPPVWRDLRPSLATLWNAFMRRVVDAASRKGSDRVVLIPTGLLALLPLHAALDASRAGDTYALDVLQISYASSATILQACRQGGPTRTATALTVGNPNSAMLHGQPLGDIVMAGWEATEIARIIRQDGLAEECVELLGDEVQLSTLCKQLPDVPLAHFACHGYFDLARPLNSRLLVSGTEDLTVSQILALTSFSNHPVIILSACGSGISGITAGGDALGLPAAFLALGAESVVASLFPVDDVACALLMQHVYEVLADGFPLAEALRQSQAFLRSLEAAEARQRMDGILDELKDFISEERLRVYRVRRNALAGRPFAAPYYWSSFVAYGSPDATPGRASGPTGQATRDVLPICDRSDRVDLL